MIRRKIYSAPPVNEKEILRYARASKMASEEELKLMRECLAEIEKKLTYRVCWKVFPMKAEDDVLDMGFAKTNSTGLRKNLEGCAQCIVFAATVGLEVDRAIRKYSRLSPAKALFFQAIGTERIEALCDLFCAEQAKHWQTEGKELRPRFSPGYGDLPLEMQKDIFRTLDCTAQIGVGLNESLLMSPSKSVTAIIGVKSI